MAGKRKILASGFRLQSRKGKIKFYAIYTKMLTDNIPPSVSQLDTKQAFCRVEVYQTKG